MKGRHLLAALAAALLAAACGGSVDTSWQEGDGYRWRALEVPRRGTPGFTAMNPRQTGVRFENFVSDSVLLGNRMLGQGAGIALGDVDGDGLVDVFLARTEGCNALYRNLGNWRFEDVTERAGVGACDRYSSGAAFADVNGNGHLDLVLLATTGPNAVFLNDGTGRFAEHGADIGFEVEGRGGTTVAMADVNGNGHLDLYVANYKPYHPVDTISPQRRAFSQLVRQVGPDRYEVVPEHRADFKVVMRPDMGGLNLSMRGAPDDFYVNEGGRFRRVPLTSSAFIDADGRRITEEPESFALGARFADLTGNGAPDLYIANDFEDTDQLWYNDGRGNFRLADWRALRQMSNSAMGVDVADVDGDGRPDLFVVDMLSNDSRRLKTQMPTHTALPKRAGEVDMQLQQQRNTLYRNRGDGTFAEVSMLAGVEASGWSWSTMFVDVDLDGWQDILVTTGHLWDIMDADTQERLQNRLSDVQWRRQRWEFPRLALRNVAYRNRGDMTFEDAGPAWRFGVDEDVSHTIAAADLDGDGDLDVIVSRLGAPVLVLRNDATAPRVAVRLAGDAPNTRGVGAKIRLLGGAIPVQEREVVVGGLYMSHSDYQATFAMGASDSAQLVVEWRDGRRTAIDRVQPNRLYEVRHSSPRSVATGSEGVRLAGAAADPAAHTTDPTLFEDVTAMLGGHRHVDPHFDDWQRQFLLPHSLSQLGPGVAWTDITGNGYEDLVVGSGRGGRLGVFVNERGRLQPRRDQGPAALGDFTTVLGVPGAGPSGRALIVGQSNWEHQTPAAVPGGITIRATTTGLAQAGEPALPPGVAATGALALADYAGDGTLGLFAGGRAIPGAYPRAASSMLYRQRDGRWVPDSVNAEILHNVGLVSSAIFADVTGNGHPDLVLARDWDSIVLLLNDGRGRYSRAPASWGLDGVTGRWNGIAAGDLTGDGRLDLVVTSWGRNTMMRPDSAHPLTILHGPFGASGAEEMLVARYDPRLRGLAPLNSYPRVRIAVRDLHSRITSFAAYADATVEQVLGPHLNNASRRSIVTLDHMVLLNRGGRFEALPLPVKAQLAPAFYVGVADFTGDGNEDVFLSQNFFPTAVGIPRYDAGRGLLLTGDGAGNLTPMEATRSGIVVYGDQRGAAYADFDRDGRLDLVVTQNGAETRLFRNRGARPGLRVRLHGPPGNPDAIGAQVRLVYDDGHGPVREIHAGSGYWSQNGLVQVFGMRSEPRALWVRWPGGATATIPIQPGAREVSIRR